jgi:hypothetical protein
MIKFARGVGRELEVSTVFIVRQKWRGAVIKRFMTMNHLGFQKCSAYAKVI